MTPPITTDDRILKPTNLINRGAARANLGMLRKAAADFEAALQVRDVDLIGI